MNVTFPFFDLLIVVTLHSYRSDKPQSRAFLPIGDAVREKNIVRKREKN
jgi:hypothetical protein